MLTNRCTCVIICLLLLSFFSLPLVLAPGNALAGPTEEELLAELAAVRQNIAEQGLRWRADLNPIARLGKEGWLAMCGSPPPPGGSQNIVFTPGNRDYPSSLDWSDLGGNWITPVRNQGGCGSCWIFAAFGSFEAQYMITSGIPDQMDIDFSEQYLMSCLTFDACDGGQVSHALNLVRDDGTPDEACFPYTANDNTPCGNVCHDYLSRLVYLDGWYWVDPEDLKLALQGGPVCSRFDVYDNFAYYYDGVYSAHGAEPTGYGHAVLITGYDDALQAWLVKNSWGPGWGGLGGYFWMAYDSGCGFGEMNQRSRWDNIEPELTDADLFPNAGVPGTVFTWSVVYTDADGDCPAVGELSLREPGSGTYVPYQMTPDGDPDCTDGTLYTISMPLTTLGTYTYRFNFLNCQGQAVTIPVGNPNYFEGPFVDPDANQDPYLSDAACVPTQGPPGTSFNFQVVYTDAENDAPVFSGLYLLEPGSETPITHFLTSPDSDYTDGALYTCDVVLSVLGQYSMRFVFFNSAGQAAYVPNETGYVDGPLVQDATGIGAGPLAVTTLGPAVPNPANPGTVLSWSLAAPGNIDLAVFDMAGRRLRGLASGSRSAGPGQVFWDGRDDNGRSLSSGVYLARLVVDGAQERQVESTKVLLVR